MKTLKLKLGTEHPGVLLVSIFHAVVGVVLAAILVLASFQYFHVGILAVFNLVLAYGLLRMKRWSVRLLAALFLPQVVFGGISLYFSLAIWMPQSVWEATAFNLSFVVYLILCLVSLVYIAVKRRDFK
ncbi:hypothetical protein GWN65_02140 [Candidatus Bathyarchaeota archaeon]|nr:hypothetical protein [Candidatus Bathyarchaeota archaeon]NIV43798.1 hypothetical protein [Candidatus Bathyarchaeota archaeon]